jgi:signal transduction histidine kinase
VNIEGVSSPLTDDFLLTLVHDFRAHVRKSLAGIQIIERSIGKELKIDLQQRFEQVIAANREMDKFLARLSDYACAASPRKGRALPLSAVVQAAVLQFPAESIKVVARPGGQTEVTVHPETIRLFSELMDNALKFSRNGPVRVEIGGQGEDAAEVKISDAGIGIPPGEVEHVFDLLVRLRSNDEYPGFGLGLPICRRVADFVGAEVKLAANPAGGTIATVTISRPD